MRGIRKVAMLLVLGALIFASEAAYSMDKAVYNYYEKVAKIYAVHHADLKKVGLTRTAKKLFDKFSAYVHLCNPRESQLIKLERIFGRQKSDVNEDNMDEVEQKTRLPQSMLEAQSSLLDIQKLLGTGGCSKMALEGTNWLNIGK